MKFLVVAAAFAVMACSGGAAWAQQISHDGDDRIQLVSELLTETMDDGDTLVGVIHTGLLEEGDVDQFEIRINPKKSYAVRGSCDFDCDDLDIMIADENGDEFDSDEEDDDAPIVFIGPGDVGRRITVHVGMATCEEDDCAWGVGVYEVED